MSVALFNAALDRPGHYSCPPFLLSNVKSSSNSGEWSSMYCSLSWHTNTEPTIYIMVPMCKLGKHSWPDLF
jgi:hypothetical protein